MAAPGSDTLLRHAGFVRGLARALLDDENDVADAVQETWVAALRSPPASDRPARPWLARVVRNAARRLRRDHARRRRRERAAARPERTASTAARAGDEETIRMVVESVLALDDPYRETVLLHYYRGLSYAEIAARCGIGVEAVRSRLARARARLRVALERRGGASWHLGLAAIVGMGREPRIAAVAGGTIMASTKAKSTVLLIAVAVASMGVGVGGTLWAVGGSPGDGPPPRARRIAASRNVDRSAPEAEPGGVEDPANSNGGPDAAAETPEENLEAQAARYLRRINRAPGRRNVALIALEMVSDLSPERARDIMVAIWPEIADAGKRAEILKPFVLGDVHPHALDVLDLAATDPDVTLRSRAFFYLRGFAFRDFSEDPAAYAAWRSHNRNRPLKEVVEEGLRAFFDRLLRADNATFARELRLVPSRGRVASSAGVDLAAIGGESGIIPVLLDRLAKPPVRKADQRRRVSEVESSTWEWIRLADPKGKATRSIIEDVLARPEAHTPISLAGAIQTLGAIDEPWAFDLLVSQLRKVPGKYMHNTLGQALGGRGDPRAIPWLIAGIVVDDCQDTRYGFGYFGLYKLAGVSWEKTHDAAWWLAWWEKNRDRYPPDVRTLDPRELARR
jgi:RNA polymerase sigma-70 factor (ECF subfamily)